jgi:hypothetical protein
MRRLRWSRSVDDDSGTALVELIGLTVMLLIPLSYLAVDVFAVQRAVFTAGAEAKEAGRTFVLSSSSDDGLDRARASVTRGELSFHPAGTDCTSQPLTPQLDPGSAYLVCVRLSVGEPAITVTGQSTVHVDDYREAR